MSRLDGRDTEGHFYPSKLARLKILHRCGECGWDLLKREVQRIHRWTRARHIGDLVHFRQTQVRPGRDPYCGPVVFAVNPEYRGGHG